MIYLVEKSVLRNYENRQVLKALLANKKMEVQEIKKLHEIDSEKIRENLTQLEKAGFLEKVEANKYTITEEGKNIFAKQLEKRKREVENLLEKINYK